MRNIFKKLTRRKITFLLTQVYAETWVIGGFMLLHLVIGPNRVYLIILTLLVIGLYKISGNFLDALWLSFLAALPFGRGRFFEYVVIPQADWVRNWDLSFNATILFSDILLVLLIYVLLSRYKKYRNKYPTQQHDLRIYLFLLIFIVVAAISVYYSRFLWTSAYFYVQVCKLVLIFIVSKIIFVNKIMVKKTTQVLGLFVLLSALFVIGQYINRGPIGLSIEGSTSLYGWFARENPDFYRPGGFSSDPNIVATLLSTFFPIFLINTLVSNKLWTRASWVGIGVIILALLFTGSRAAWVVTAAIAIFGVWHVRKKKRIYIPALLRKYWLILVAIFLILSGSVISSRLMTLVDVFQKEGGGTYRLEHIKVSLKYLRLEPFGVGPGLFPFAMAEDFPMDESGFRPTLAHNIFAQIGAEVGFVGLISFIVVLYLLMRSKLRSIIRGKQVFMKNSFDFSILLAFLSFSLLMMVFPWFLHPRLSSFFWILAGYSSSQK